MSDTKILSGEQVRNVFRMGSDISMVQVCESHAAQAQKIEALESQIIDLLGGVVREAENSIKKSSVSVEEFKAFLFQEGIPTRNELKRLIFSHAELADDLAEKNRDLHSSKRALRRIITEHSERQRERDAALLRAEAAEALIKDFKVGWEGAARDRDYSEAQVNMEAHYHNDIQCRDALLETATATIARQVAELADSGSIQVGCEKFLQVEMFARGCISGGFSEWPLLRAEVRKLLDSYTSQALEIASLRLVHTILNK